MNVLGIIPARKGSKGIKNKNLKKIGNKTLIDIAIDSALKSKINFLLISSNDERIEKIAKKKKIFFIKRPKKLCNSKSKSIDAIIHAINFLKKKKLFFDAVMMLQPTSPFRTAKDINNSIDMLRKNKSFDSCISVQNVNSFHPARMKFIKNKKLIDHSLSEKTENQPRQTLKKMYIRNGSIYLTKMKTILKKSFKGRKSMAYIMPDSRSINIDCEFDLTLARFLHK